MIDHRTALDILAAAETRRAARRRFLKVAGGGTLALGSATLLSGCFDDDDDDVFPTPTPSPTPTPTPTTGMVSETDVLNLALNLEYLEAQFYSYAANGSGLAASMTASGSGTAGGMVTGGQKVDFSGDRLVGAYAREIAADEAAHVAFLRSALGSAAVAMPDINISGGADGAFTAAARAAGVIGASDTFNPYSSPENFLLGAFIFEDVGVTAYKGAAPFLMGNKVFLEAAAGILAAEAYHAGLVRTVLYAKGMDTDALLTAAQKISDARDTLDKAPAADDDVRGIAADDDQGLTDGDGANVVPTNVNGIVYSRTSEQVHNIVYLNTGNNVNGGGFFPAGTNNPNPALTVGF